MTCYSQLRALNQPKNGARTTELQFSRGDLFISHIQAVQLTIFIQL